MIQAAGEAEMAGFLDRLRLSSAAARLVEEELYEQVVRELSEGQRRDGLWAKAIAHSDGSEDRAKALYIKYRVQSLRDELEIAADAVNKRAESARAAASGSLEQRVTTAQKALESKRYKLKRKGSGWVILEPLGGRHKVASIEELEEYVRAHVRP